MDCLRAFIAPLIAVCAVTASSASTIDFNRDIRPILSANCFACHGPDANARKAGLRLDKADAAYALREDGITAIKPSDLAASEIWKRITSSDADEVMPPPESHRTLSDNDKAKVRAWIEAGARYDEHWAFVA
ncbi:MAG: c-type cytochrome, partial [Limnohabitans sp.]|nr:c-type cytochrome [Limnohabitans sp.]